MTRRYLGCLVLVVLASCGAPDKPVVSGAPSQVAAVTPATTAAPTATTAAPTATTAAPTATTAVSTATPLPSATPVPTVVPTPTTPPDATVLPTGGGPARLDQNDVPVLNAAQAPPTSPPAPPAGQVPAAPAQPVRMQLPAIGLDEWLVAVGLDAQRVPIVPKHQVGWYSYSARPGEGENVVMWGHVLRWQDAPTVPAPFARMQEVRVGAIITVTTANGGVHRYRVTQQIQVLPTQVQYILPVGSERLTLVSCIGDNVIQNGTLTKQFRLLTLAEPLS